MLVSIRNERRDGATKARKGGARILVCVVSGEHQDRRETRWKEHIHMWCGVCSAEMLLERERERKREKEGARGGESGREVARGGERWCVSKATSKRYTH